MTFRDASLWRHPDVPRGIRTVRWGFAALVLVGAALGPATGAAGAARGVAAALLALPLAALNLASARPGARLDRPSVRGRAALAFAVDTAVGVGAVLLLASGPLSPGWALLGLPIIEGAVRAELAGAIVAWGAAAVEEGVRGLLLADGAASLAGAWLTPTAGALGLRVGILLALAIGAGLHTRHLGNLLRARHHALLDARRRASGLATVARAGRRMTTLEGEDVLAATDGALAALGFDALEVAIADGSDTGWRVVHRRGLSADVALAPVLAAEVDPVEDGPIVVDADGSGVLESAGLTTAVACPVWPGGELVALVVAGRRARAAVTADERECLELLAGQVGAALTVADQYGRQRRFGEQLVAQATTDALTGLVNRARFLERVEEVSGRPAAVLFLDLDRFKPINDRLGHQTGDEVLRIVARRLQGTLRPEDVLARYGGDEFAVLLVDVGDAADAVVVARRMLSALEGPVTVAGSRLQVTASIGIALSARATSGAAELLEDADGAMYRAKRDGGSGVALGDTAADEVSVEIVLAEERVTPDAGR